MRGLIVLFLTTAVCASSSAKSGPTYFTPERVAIAHENVEKCDWAKKQLERIVERGDPIRYYIGPIYVSARKFAAQSDEFIWLLQPTTEIPRTYDYGEHPRAMCPVHGGEIKKFNSFNPWRIDPIAHPYQIQCPVGGEWYPSNRYDQGDMTSGDFPDDGSGCLYEGKRYYFLIEYAHMAYGSVVVPALKSFSEAYLLTGDAVYARKGCILMARLATQYPNYGWEGTDFDLEDRTERTYLGPYGGYHPHYKWKQGGLITDLIWGTFMLEWITYAYDGLYDAFDDPEVLAFVKSKGMPVETGDDLREYIESYILRSGMVALQRGLVHGNQGHHQASAMALALVLDDYGDRHPNSRDMVEYTYHGIGRSAYIMDNGLTRDGGGHESPNYNKIKLDFIRASKAMDEIRALHPSEFPEERYPDIFANPKAKELFNHLIDSSVLDYWLPPIGDNGGLRKPRRVGPQRYSQAGAENLFAFLKYGDPRFARALTNMDGEFFKGELWEPYPEEELRRALEDPRSRIERRSRLLDGYGVAILEAGEYPNSRALTLNYSSTIGHRQMDQLSIGLYARGVELLEDLGYPRTWDYRWQWDSHNMAHNTVTVNESRFTSPRFFRNAANLFASVDGVHVVTAHHNPYESLSCDLYERTDVMVEVDEERFYVVDLFAVNGGDQHDQSWLAMYVEPEAPELDWAVQETGTLAGPHVPEFAAYTDRWGHEHPSGDFPSYLTEIRRAPLDRPATWTWRSGLPEGDGIALHIVPVDGPVEAIMGKGRSPVWVEDKAGYLLVRRHVEAGGPTHYLTVLDPFQEEPEILGVRVMSTDPIVLEVERPDGVDEITIHIPGGPSRTTAHRPLGVRVVVREGDEVRKYVQIGSLDSEESPGGGLAEGSDRPRRSPGYAQGQIEALNYDAREIVIAGDELTTADFGGGRGIRIYNDMRTAMYTIEQAEVREGRLVVTLDKPALLSRFPVTNVENGRLELGVKGPFVTGHTNKETGELTDGPNDYYYGAWVGEGHTARLVEGISNSSPACLHLAGEVDDDDLARDYVGRVVPVWYYAVGDQVEVARIRR